MQTVYILIDTTHPDYAKIINQCKEEFSKTRPKNNLSILFSNDKKQALVKLVSQAKTSLIESHAIFAIYTKRTMPIFKVKLVSEQNWMEKFQESTEPLRDLRVDRKSR